MRLAAALASILALSGCPSGPATPPPPSGGILVEGSPPEAEVLVNDRIVGMIRYLSVTAAPLRPGNWRVEVTAPGFFPWYGEVEVGTAVETIRVDLRSIPP